MTIRIVDGMTVQIVQMKDLVSNPERSGQRTTSGISLGSGPGSEGGSALGSALGSEDCSALALGSDGVSAVMLR